jgi:hypothetical protein
MNSDLDHQGRRGVWPNPIDTPLDRARRIASMYRARLRALDTAACDDCDATAAGFGEMWMLEKPDLVDEHQDWTTSEAADEVRVSAGTIRKWACTPHPAEQRMLLPRLGQRNGERTYLARHVLEAAAIVARQQHAKSRA